MNVTSDVNILLVSSQLSSFVARDLKILRERHIVVVRFVHHVNPFRFLGDVHTLWKSDLLFVWFASGFALPLVIAARLLGKRIATVVGGYEAANEPEIRYGSARSPFMRRVVRWILVLSDQVLAVSLASMRQIQVNFSVPEARLHLLYHGFEDIAQNIETSRKTGVVTIGQITDETWMVKGIYDFVAIAEQMPGTQFVHVGGLSIDVAAKFGRQLPPNLTFKGVVPYDQIGRLLSSAKVYLQLSRHESFGCSVAEAMLCRCIPVVANAAALPEVVGNCGIVLESRDAVAVTAAVQRALKMPESEGEKARQWILTHFAYERRRDDLLKMIDEVGAT